MSNGSNIEGGGSNSSNSNVNLGFTFNVKLFDDATLIRNGTLINDVSEDFTAYNQMNIYFRECNAPDIFYRLSKDDYRFKFDTSNVKLDLSALSSNVINSSDGSQYYLSYAYDFHSLYDPSATRIQVISNVKSRVRQDVNSDGYKGEMFASNQTAIVDLARFSDYRYLDVYANSFYTILQQVNNSAYAFQRKSIYERLVQAGRWNGTVPALQNGDYFQFGIVFNISQQVTNVVPGLNVSGDGNFYINFGGQPYIIPQFDVCSAIITQCYAVNLIQTINVDP